VSAKKGHLTELANKSAEINVQIEVDELLAEVMNVIKNIDFADKFKVIRDIIDKVIVSERSGAEVWAHLPLPVTITEKLGYEPQRRDTYFAVPTFDFYFRINIPKKRKDREIVERNYLGRILKTKVPELHDPIT